jgi:hypothetical protein
MTHPEPDPIQSTPEFIKTAPVDLLPIVVALDGDALTAYLNENVHNAKEAALVLLALSFMAASFHRSAHGYTSPLNEDAPDKGTWSLSADSDAALSEGEADQCTRNVYALFLSTLNQDAPVAAAIAGSSASEQQLAADTIEGMGYLAHKNHHAMHEARRRPGIADDYCGCKLPGYSE